MASFVRYIDRTRDYYQTKSYEKPYQWAHFDDVPFAQLKKPLRESRVVLISTGEVTVRDAGRDGDEGKQTVGGTYTLASDIPADRLYSPSHSYDRVATTLEDVDSFYPTTALHDAVKAGRIGSLTKRFFGVHTAYSQRRTIERDAPIVLERCREDGADIAVLVPV